MADELFAGLDLGTQSVKAVVVDRGGEVVASASRPLRSRRAGERHEQEPNAWWDAVCAACREAVTGLGVSAVAVCATSGTILLVNDAGEPLTPGVMYDDARGDADRVNAAGAGLWAELGYARMPRTWALPKLVRLLRDQPNGRLAHQADFVTRRLAGHAVAADSSHALKTGYDLVRERWPEDVLGELGIARDALPAVVRAGEPLGEVCDAAAAATGLAAGTPLIAGMTDGCAAQIAAGALHAGSWNSVLGTTLVVKGVSQTLVHDPGGVVYSHRSPTGDWLPGGASNTGAGALRAFEDLPKLDRAAKAHEPAGALAYPLVGRGERFPFAAPEAEAFMLGTPADEGDHHAALLQGVAYVERLTFDYLDLLGAPADGPLTLTGGATRSRYWCELRADILGRPVRLPRAAEPAVGMAVLAAAGVGGRPLPAVAEAMVHVREELEPRDPARWHAPYLRFVAELESRGWLPTTVAEHARRRAEP